MGKSFVMRLTVLLIMLLLIVVSREASGEPLQNRTARQQACLENHEYPHMGFCCKNCEAGTYVKEKCSADQQKGVCALCEPGTYAEHPTGMEQCLQCSQCHMDQIRTQPCTSNRNTQCECKAGFFCLPDEPCEVCKKCTRCKPDEIEEHKCTPTSNTKCRKRPPSPHDPTIRPTLPPEPSKSYAVTIVLVLVFIFIIGAVVGAGVWIWKKKFSCRRQASPVAPNDEVKIPIDGVCVPSAEEKENCRNADLEEAEEPRPESRPLLQETQGLSTKSMPVEDEDRGLGDSLPNTTSSSQTSLSALPITAPSMGESPRHSPRTQRPTLNGEKEPETWARDDCPPRKLVPLHDNATSLSKSFDLFDSLDMRMHNKFFRSIGLNDNTIKQAESQNAGDKVYELLRNWMQREGLRANINDLLQALLELDQRYTAEQIASKAVDRGYYKYE
ncbi:tumor necrosis factor receptor superfamily, member a [Pygocentrus nattereri]|uniref:Tumor necrosis factor receptor superfamily, member a n=1 Tax=Pygocentrus nattereri TaxID=42514 RepID=A0A3B4CL66_PYGNA|nr:tumor necrosis factor receptor superfamily, member a [Pygocentrus nattereri]